MKIHELFAYIAVKNAPKAITHLRRSAAPQICERRVSLGQLIGRHAEQHRPGAGAQLHADEALTATDRANVEARPRAADDDVADVVRHGPAGVIEQAQRMVGEPERQVHGASR